MINLLNSIHSGPPTVVKEGDWYVLLSEKGNSASLVNVFGPYIVPQAPKESGMQISINGVDYQYQLAGLTYMFKQRGSPPPLMPGFEQGGNEFEQVPSLQPCEHRGARTFINGCCPKTVKTCSFFGTDLTDQCHGCLVPTTGTSIADDEVVVIEPNN